MSISSLLDVYTRLDPYVKTAPTNPHADPPLPSYNALMASESGSGALTYSPAAFTQAGSADGHYRTPSLDQATFPLPDYPPGMDFSQPNPNSNPNRSSGGSIPLRRPISEPNDLDMSNLRLTSDSPANPPISRNHTLPANPYPPRGPYPPRQRAVTGGYEDRHDGAASVYSLDSGIGAHARSSYDLSHPPPPPPQPYDAYSNNPYPQQDYANPYYSAASDFLGLPPSAQTQSYPTSSPNSVPTQSTSSLNRTNTSVSSLSSTSQTTLSRKATQIGASSTRRRGTQAAIDVNKPPYTKQYVDDYRKRMKDDPDPEAQFAFSKYLIEAAKKLGDEVSLTDARVGRKYRDLLLTESLKNVKKLAEGKEPYGDAQFFLANLYGTGQLGIQVDHEKAYYLYLMASKQNHPAATYRSAVCNEIGAGTRKDPHRATLFYRKAAALGDTAAMYKLGMILLGGLLGHERNPREAIIWLRRAAGQADEDNPHALHELALLHERPNNGGVVPSDPNMARELFTQAAQLGYAPAQFKLGSCHEFGTLGCQIDPRRSIAWYTRAAEKGDSEAELALSGWYLTGSEGVLKQSDTEAYLWGRKAANKGLAKAEYAVGYYTEIGIGVKQDIELAKRWYMRAAAQQHKRAMQRLTEMNNTKNAKTKKGAARPTRSDAQSECRVM
ncbi:uncharacterized protein P7C73_g5114, partial [Tremellales sp. Uapishka_1]